MEINEAFERYLQFCMFEKQLTNVTITDYKDDFKKFSRKKFCFEK